MKKRSQFQPATALEDGQAHWPRTGEHCPANGWWVPANNDGDVYFITQGSIMPASGGAPIWWKPFTGRLERP